jgi:vitamin K-dependent gamma-carboxylase
MVKSFDRVPGFGPYLRGRLGSLQFRDRRVAARPTGGAAAPVATHAALRIRSGSCIQSHQRVIFDIGIFPWLMLGALLIFFPPDLLRRFARAFMSPGEEFLDAEPSRASVSTIAERSSCPSLFASQKLVAGLLAAYLAVQLLFPLRHYLYPGNVSWTEEGHNFSWHMKLRTKGGEAVFTVTHPESGQTWTIKPEDYLESHQVMKMITKPDLILLFGHYLAEEKRREGYENVEVRARVMVSLNGRQPQLLIDPNVDLAKEQVSLLPARWIVPLTTPLAQTAPAKPHS